MKNNRKILFASGLLFFVGILISSSLLSNKQVPIEVEAFSLSDLVQDFLSRKILMDSDAEADISILPNTDTNKYLGTIMDEYDAREKANLFWKEQYERKEKRHTIYYDKSEGVWYVTGFFSRPPSLEGGSHLLIRESDGKVLAFWLEQ